MHRRPEGKAKHVVDEKFNRPAAIKLAEEHAHLRPLPACRLPEYTKTSALVRKFGKSRLACALGHALVEAGRSVLFTPTYQLVQTLLPARRDLRLPKALRALEVYDAVIVDDLGFVQQNADEAEVLFTLMAERYERRSLIITSNLVISEWNRIFKSPMTTAAASRRS